MSRELLERNCPELRYDLFERDHAGRVEDIRGRMERRSEVVMTELDVSKLDKTYPNGITASPLDYIDFEEQPKSEPTTYAYVVEQGGYRWLLYWYWYFFNGWHYSRSGYHWGDWEGVVLRVPQDSESPDLAAYAQHNGGRVRRIEDVQLVDDHVVVYVALGSHASMFDRSPIANGLGRHERPPVEVVSPDTHPWMMWPGRWGSSRLGGKWSDSPRSPGVHRQGRDPAGWVAFLRQP